jgi:hypothetical protein
VAGIFRARLDRGYFEAGLAEGGNAQNEANGESHDR